MFGARSTPRPLVWGSVCPSSRCCINRLGASTEHSRHTAYAVAVADRCHTRPFHRNSCRFCVGASAGGSFRLPAVPLRCASRWPVADILQRHTLRIRSIHSCALREKNSARFQRHDRREECPDGSSHECPENKDATTAQASATAPSDRLAPALPLHTVTRRKPSCSCKLHLQPDSCIRPIRLHSRLHVPRPTLGISSTRLSPKRLHASPWRRRARRLRKPAAWPCGDPLRVAAVPQPLHERPRRSARAPLRCPYMLHFIEHSNAQSCVVVCDAPDGPGSANVYVVLGTSNSLGPKHIAHICMLRSRRPHEFDTNVFDIETFCRCFRRRRIRIYVDPTPPLDIDPCMAPRSRPATLSATLEVMHVESGEHVSTYVCISTEGLSHERSNPARASRLSPGVRVACHHHPRCETTAAVLALDGARFSSGACAT